MHANVSAICKVYREDATKHILAIQTGSSITSSKVRGYCTRSLVYYFCSSYQNDPLRVKRFVSQVINWFSTIM